MNDDNSFLVPSASFSPSPVGVTPTQPGGPRGPNPTLTLPPTSWPAVGRTRSSGSAPEPGPGQDMATFHTPAARAELVASRLDGMRSPFMTGTDPSILPPARRPPVPPADERFQRLYAEGPGRGHQERERRFRRPFGRLPRISPTRSATISEGSIWPCSRQPRGDGPASKRSEPGHGAEPATGGRKPSRSGGWRWPLRHGPGGNASWPPRR